MKEKITYSSLIRLHGWRFLKRQTSLVIVTAFLVAGLYGLFQGFAVKRQHQATITAFRQERDSALHKIKSGFSADTLTKEGKTAFNAASGISAINFLYLPVYKYPVSTAIFNTGQSDVFTYYYSFRLESFIMQLFKQAEISNPLRSLTGHFDVSFWIVYLLPLLMLLLCFNAFSAEEESDNWKLIASQGISARKWLISKFILAGSIIGLLLLIIAMSGILLNAIYFRQSPGYRDLLFFIAAAVYLLFWLAILYYICSLRKSTGFNAMSGGLLWIGICILLPGMISKAAEIAVPVDNTAISTFSRRPQDTRMDKDPGFADSLLNAFIRQDTVYRFSNISSSSPAFQSKAYRAWHTMLDRQRWPVVKKYYDAVERRQSITNFSGVLNPASGMDGILTGLAGNDAEAYHHFTETARQFHLKMRNALYPPLFFDRDLQKEDYDKLPVFQYYPPAVSKAVIVDGLLLLLLSFFLFIRAGKKLSQPT